MQTLFQQFNIPLDGPGGRNFVSNKLGIANQPGELNDTEWRLLEWLRRRRKDEIETSPSMVDSVGQPICTIQLDPRILDGQMTEQYLRQELEWQSSRLEDFRYLLRVEPWGYDLLICLHSRYQFHVQLPLEYPSDRYYLRILTPDTAAELMEKIQHAVLRIFTPVSLTALVNIICNFCR